jgi:hypothetical protein
MREMLALYVLISCLDSQAMNKTVSCFGLIARQLLTCSVIYLLLLEPPRFPYSLLKHTIRFAYSDSF